MKNKLQNHLIMVTTMVFMTAGLAFDGNFSKSFLLSLMLLFYAVCIIRPDELSQSDAQD